MKPAREAPESGEQPPRVLVVDDNEDNRDMLSRRLKRKGYQTATAEDGEAALKALEESEYDVVLLDVMMPGMSGIEVLERVRETQSKTQLPVIMATAKSDSADVVEALKAGANDYVTKPIDFPVLIARLETQLAVKEEAASQAKAIVDLTAGIEFGTVIEERYEIQDPVGEGGFACVYRAKQLSTGQVVAFKCALPDRVRRDEGGVEMARFEREMKLIGSLRHQHIVRLIDSGSITVHAPPQKKREGTAPPDAATTTGGRAPKSGTRRAEEEVGDPVLDVPYIVMEFLDGRTLADLLKKKAPLDVEDAVDLVLPVLSALGAAHQHGVIHRDVKPHNVLLVDDKRGGYEPKVVDFGIAKLTAPDERALTINEAFIGTPEYMAPEQATGKPPLDARADQFAAAAILYQALTGRGLYKADNFFALIHAVAQAEFSPPREHRADLPAELEAVLLRALSRKRDNRFDTVEEFAQALLPFASKPASRRWGDELEAAKLAASSAPPVPPSQDAVDDGSATTMKEGVGAGIAIGDAPLSDEESMKTVAAEITMRSARGLQDVAESFDEDTQVSAAQSSLDELAEQAEREDAADEEEDAPPTSGKRRAAKKRKRKKKKRKTELAPAPPPEPNTPWGWIVITTALAIALLWSLLRGR